MQVLLEDIQRTLHARSVCLPGSPEAAAAAAAAATATDMAAAVTATAVAAPPSQKHSRKLSQRGGRGVGGATVPRVHTNLSFAPAPADHGIASPEDLAGASVAARAAMRPYPAPALDVALSSSPPSTASTSAGPGGSDTAGLGPEPGADADADALPLAAPAAGSVVRGALAPAPAGTYPRSRAQDVPPPAARWADAPAAVPMYLSATAGWP